MVDIWRAPADKVFEDWDIKTEHDTYEVKYDRWFERTGNLLVETYSDRDNGSLGWLFKTRATWLIVFFNDHEFYGCSMEDLRNAFFNYPELWRMIEVPQDTGRVSVCWVAKPSVLFAMKYGDVRK